MYFIVNKTTRELIRQSDSPFNIDESVQPSDPHIQLKRVDDPTKPAFNAATQKLVYDFVDNDSTFTRTYKWMVVSQTAEEQADTGEREQIKALIADLNAGTGTAAARTTRLEKVAVYLLKKTAGLT